MHEQMSLRCLADLPAKDQEALDIFAGRGDLVGLRLDHIMKALDQPPVRRERVELGGQANSGQGSTTRASPRRRNARRVPGCRRWRWRGAVRLVLIGSLSRWQSYAKFSRIKAEGDTANGRYRIESCRSADDGDNAHRD